MTIDIKAVVPVNDSGTLAGNEVLWGAESTGAASPSTFLLSAIRAYIREQLVVAPAGATDNALARFDGGTGELIQDSTATLSDAGVLTLTSLVSATRDLSESETFAVLPSMPANAPTGKVRVYARDVAGQIRFGFVDESGNTAELSNTTGDVIGSGASTDNAIPRHSGTSGKVIEATGAKVLDDHSLSTPAKFESAKIATPANAAAGSKSLYFGTDGELRTIDEAGALVEIGGAAIAAAAAVGTAAAAAGTAHAALTNNPHGVTKAQVGLGSADNTSDADKPVSTATATALATHAALTNNPHGVTKAQVGLGNADNTSDADKPVSTATATALGLKLDDSQAGAFGLTLLGAALVGDARTSLALVPGTDVQAYSANLAAWSALATSAKQDASANLASWSALAPASKLDASSYTAADVLAKLLTVDGAASGLDADTLDGNSSAAFVLASSYTAADVLAKLVTVDGAGSGLDADTLDGNSSAAFVLASAYTAADVLSKLLTVDGAGSGLDADLLDGVSSASFGRLDTEDQVLTGGARVTSKSLATGSVTLDPGDRPLQYITNGGAFTITAPANDGSLILLVANNGTAGAITFSGFQVSASVGDALTTTNGHEFMIFVVRINGFATYTIKALQ